MQMHWTYLMFIMWRILLLLLDFTASIDGQLFMRCYCNLPECITAGNGGLDLFTCKSRMGCFQELPHYNHPQPQYSTVEKSSMKGQPVQELRYGCLELWPVDSTPFQCTEPGIRKAPLQGSNGGRRYNGGSVSVDNDLDYGQYIPGFDGRVKHGDRLSGRRRSPTRQQSRHLRLSYDVPLRCCIGDMCNKRRHSTGVQSMTKSTYSMASTSTTPPTVKTTITSIDNNSLGENPSPHHPWWFTSTIIFVSAVGIVTFLLLLAAGCWILHLQNGGDAIRKLAIRRTTVSIPARCYLYDGPTGGATTKLVRSDSLDRMVTRVVVEAVTDPQNETSQRYLHIPIFLSKQHSPDRSILNVKPLVAKGTQNR